MERIVKLIMFSLVFIASSCEKYLDQKPDKKLVVPSTVYDAQAMLDNSSVFNIVGPLSVQLAGDEHYLLAYDWVTATLTDRNSYIWNEDVFNDGDSNDWSLPYVSVYYANIILDALKRNELVGTEEQLKIIEGQSLFVRSFAFYNLLQVFAKPFFIDGKNGGQLGIPLRLTSDPNIRTVRADLKTSYYQIIDDLKLSVDLLPENVTVKTRASKLASHALLARIYLNIGDYESALNHANTILVNNSGLLDYNNLESSQPYPFKVFNEEVIYHSQVGTRKIMTPPFCKIDSNLFGFYSENDLRKTLFFLNNNDGTQSFRGSYAGSVNLFNGLAYNEIYLIRSECYMREGRIEEGMNDLNYLLRKRHREGSFTSLNILHKEEALDKVLLERRKELIFRGTRWSDLRRLNNDPARLITIKRMLEGKEYLLLPNDKRYVFPIPLTVIEMTEIEQNL